MKLSKKYIHDCGGSDNDEFWCYQENEGEDLFLKCDSFGETVQFCPYCGYSKNTKDIKKENKCQTDSQDQTLQE